MYMCTIVTSVYVYTFISSLTKLSSPEEAHSLPPRSGVSSSSMGQRGRSWSNLSLSHAPSMSSVIEEPRRSTSTTSKSFQREADGVTYFYTYTQWDVYVNNYVPSLIPRLSSMFMSLVHVMAVVPVHAHGRILETRLTCIYLRS